MASPRRKGMAMTIISEKTNELLKNDRVQIIDEIISEELKSMNIMDIPLEQLYSAPAKWNEWHRLPEEKLIQLCESIAEIGQQAPCIVWRIDKAKVLSLYDAGEIDSYGFQGDKYMILSGHNRAFCRKLIGGTVEHSDDELYKVAPCIVYDEPVSEEFIEKAQQIIDDTNFLSRENTTKEVIRAVIKKTKAMKDNTRQRNSDNIAEQIAKSLNLTKRTVLSYNKLNKELIPQILDLVFDEKLSIRSALAITALGEEVQKKLYFQMQSVLTDKKKVSKLAKDVRKDMTFEEIQEMFPENDFVSSFKKVTVTIPTDKEEEFQELLLAWKTGKVSL